MEAETFEIVKYTIVGIFVVAIALYFTTKANFEAVLLTMVIAGVIFLINKRETYSMEGE